MQQNAMKAYFFPMMLMISVVLGGVVGSIGGPFVLRLQPLGDLFLNLIFTVIVPLIFFSVSSAIAQAGHGKKLGRIFFYMTLVFIFTGIIAALLTILAVKFFPIGQTVFLPLATRAPLTSVSFANQLVGVFTVTDFSALLSHQHMLALIVFSMLVGFAAAATAEKNAVFVAFLKSGEAIFMRVFGLIMVVAPIGFFAYFAVLVQKLGPQLMNNYFRIGLFYYLFASAYFLVVWTLYAYLAGKKEGVCLFWKQVFLPSITAIATCSSAASIPANLTATRNMRVPAVIYETVVPLGSMMHKEGSIIGGIVKIAFLFSLFHMDFSGPVVLLTALGVALLVGTVMGAIPSGGMLGELLILSIYGFPSQALIVIAAISIIIDPMATLLNVTGNSVSSMLIARLVEGKSWLFLNKCKGLYTPRT